MEALTSAAGAYARRNLRVLFDAITGLAEVQTQALQADPGLLGKWVAVAGLVGWRVLPARWGVLDAGSCQAAEDGAARTRPPCSAARPGPALPRHPPSCPPPLPALLCSAG